MVWANSETSHVIDSTRTQDHTWLFSSPIYTYSYFEKGCQKNVQATVPKGNLGYVQYTFLDTVAVKPTFVAFL